jgi:hypothetical protein
MSKLITREDGFKEEKVETLVELCLNDLGSAWFKSINIIDYKYFDT